MVITSLTITQTLLNFVSKQFPSFPVKVTQSQPYKNKKKKLWLSNCSSFHLLPGTEIFGQSAVVVISSSSCVHTHH